ncbi:MAG: ShlB/FhaC/HecB family hemolysin secretion/activation protein [Pseudomonadota bacterium]|nr:ShlB/FhaC/HecB family hemolysin secretion/activation protein [Pseudomonadota bacterium]
MSVHSFAASRVLAALILLSPVISLAQQTPPTPGSVTDTLKPAPRIEPLPPAPVDTPTPQSRAEVPAGGREITVERFVFEGNTAYDDATLDALVADYLGRPVTLYDLYEAADRLAAHYISQGYTLTTVAIPAQRVDRGEVVFEVIEGRVGRVRAEGTARYQEAHLRHYLDEVHPGELYRTEDLERGLRQLNELPGLSARAVVEPGQAYGSSDIVLRAEETPVRGGVFLDNHGRDSIGEYRATVNLELNNPTRTEDQLRLLYLQSEDALLRYGFVEYSVPLNFRGPRLAASYGQSDFEVGDGPFEGLVEGTNRDGRVALNWPLIITRNERLVLSPAVRRTVADTDQFGLVERGTRITLLDLGASYSRAFANRSVIQLSGSLSSNFGSQSREDLSAPDSVGTEQKLRAEVDLQQLSPLWREIFVYTRVAAVWSPDPLVDTEQFSLGGPNSVRGYPAAEVRGDRGYLATLGLNQRFGFGAVTLDGRVFVDAGSVYVVDAPDGADSHVSIASIGIGGDLSLPAGFGLRLDLAFPFGDRRDEISDGHDDGRLYGVVSYRF